MKKLINVAVVLSMIAWACPHLAWSASATSGPYPMTATIDQIVALEVTLTNELGQAVTGMDFGKLIQGPGAWTSGSFSSEHKITATVVSKSTVPCKITQSASDLVNQNGELLDRGYCRVQPQPNGQIQSWVGTVVLADKVAPEDKVVAVYDIAGWGQPRIAGDLKGQVTFTITAL